MSLMLAHDQETIIAQCTPYGQGALALIRISGLNAIQLTANMAELSSHKSILDLPTHTIHHGTIVSLDKTIIDQVLFLLMHGPRTFTGQDTIEITCHNNPLIIEQIIERALILGARMATPGEFSKRSVLNNKISVLQAEAIHEVVTANTQAALKLSLAQLEGSISAWCIKLERELIRALALSEASFEFIDEEHLAFGSEIREIIIKVQQQIAHINIQGGTQKHIRDGIRIALIGATNAGKSSLFNALIGQNRSIVTNIPGTTRDTVEAGLYRNGAYWTLIDTAGFREITNSIEDSIEKEGIARSYSTAQNADLILLVIDLASPLPDDLITEYQQLLSTYSEKIIIVKSKSDLPQIDPSLSLLKTGSFILTPELSKFSIPEVSISIDTINSNSIGTNTISTYNAYAHNKSISCLDIAIQERIKALLNANSCPFLLNQRQLQSLIQLSQKLDFLILLLREPIQYELLSHHILDSLATISDLTGKSLSEKGLDAVFREFCVGK